MRAFAFVFGLSMLASGAIAQPKLIVRLVDGTNPGAVSSTYGLKFTDRTESAPFALYTVPVGMDPHLAQTLLQGDARVVWAEDDMSLTMPEHAGGGKGGTIAAIGGRDALYAENTGLLTQISWNSTTANTPGREMKVAVLDTGLSYRHPTLWTQVVAAVNFVETRQNPSDWPRNTSTSGNATADDAVGHGTMVAGLINQISPLSKLIIVRVADSDGVSSAWRLVKGLAYAVQHGASVANISLGSIDGIPALNDTLDWAAEEKNLVVVAAIGNNSQSSALEPSDSSKVICVSGIDSRNLKASFSNWDSSADVSAPAVGVKSFWYTGQLGIWSGTSFAAPLVAGAVADGLRLRQSTPSASSVRLAAKSTGDGLIDSLNPDYRGKLGRRLNVRRLIERVGTL
ncbi:MAG TPA: S8 family serine peptidase [Fimbriimonadaceae bacterium]|nr:S8 family serine peptidase [Fimbriimonadaceae bacterium]